MRTELVIGIRLGSALLLVAGALTTVTVRPAAAVTPVMWVADLSAGEAAGVRVTGGTAALDPRQARLATPDEAVTGFLTLGPHELARPTDRVDARVVGDLPAGSTVTVDIRGRRAATGGWTEWIPATPTAASSHSSPGTARLPEPSSRVQGRLVLTGYPRTGPLVRDLRLTAHPADAASGATGTDRHPALRYSVLATREGLVGAATANGHVVTERDHFVALPSRRVLSPRDSGDYSVQVCGPTGRCGFAPVWDVGPWNTRDDYWNPASIRQEWADLPQGVPEAQAAYRTGYHGGRDQYGRTVANPAGIDLADGVFRDALGLTDNSVVTVDYLWTGSTRLEPVSSPSGSVEVRAAPSVDAAVVGLAADRASVPVRCAWGRGTGGWLRIGEDQYVAAAAVPGAREVPVCAGLPQARG